MMKRVYYLEDDPKIALTVKMSIETLNTTFPVEVSIFEDYISFYDGLTQCKPNLIILDLNLPDVDGYEVLQNIKQNPNFSTIPVVVVSCKTGEYDRVKCLEAGAVAYYTKPFFGIIEFNTTIKNFMNVSSNQLLAYSNITIDHNSKVVTKDNKEVKLTSREYELLRYLILNKDKCISKEVLCKDIWNNSVDIKSRTVDMHIKILRQKVFYDDVDKLLTITKRGYKLVYA